MKNAIRIDKKDGFVRIKIKDDNGQHLLTMHVDNNSNDFTEIYYGGANPNYIEAVDIKKEVTA